MIRVRPINPGVCHRQLGPLSGPCLFHSIFHVCRFEKNRRLLNTSYLNDTLTRASEDSRQPLAGTKTYIPKTNQANPGQWLRNGRCA
jgi:hypothetical protein